MTFRDTAHLALRNLRQAKLRTTLTTLGVAIGIASLAGMVSLGVGLQDQLVGQFVQSGVFDSITVMPAGPGGRGGFGRGAPFGGRARGAGGRGGRSTSAGAARGTDEPTTPIVAPAPEVPLDEEAVQKLAALPGVKDAYPSISVPVDVTLGDFSETFGATGVPMSSGLEGVFRSMAAGSFFQNGTDDACLLSLDVAKRIDAANPKTLVGQTLTLSYAARGAGTGDPAISNSGAPAVPGPAALMQLRRVTFSCPVVGIVEREASPGPFGGRGVANLMIPLSRAKTIAAENVTNVQSLLRERTVSPKYASVTVKVMHAQATQEVEDRIKEMGFSAFSLNDALQGAKRAFIILDIVLSLIGSIALAVSSLGIMNTMVMSILERTREIGIMKAIGGSDGDIRRIFLVEAAAIGVMGGVAGLLLGWIVGRAINFGANIYIVQQGGTAANLFSLPWWLIGGALGFSIVVSVLAGSYPARRAARLEPMQALRHD
ncbi:MAG: ABC transporter permease [Vicinamibacterales bacterium]